MGTTPGKKKVPPVYTPKIVTKLTPEKLEELMKEGEKARQEVVERTRGMNFLSGAERAYRVKGSGKS
jgi:hypothetical protein